MDSFAGLETYKKKTWLKILFFVVSLAFAIYFINYPFNFFKVPESVLNFENWIAFVGGILILIGAVNFLRAGKKF